MIHEYNSVAPENYRAKSKYVDLWKKLRGRKKLALDYRDEFQARGYTDQAKRLAGCSTYLHVREWTNTGTRRLRNANFCQQTRICPACGNIAAIRNACRLASKVEEVVCSYDVVPVLLTFTIKNTASLKEGLQTLLSGLGQVSQRRRNSGKGRHPRNCWGSIQGAAIRVEIKRGKNAGEWHPHAHALVLRDRLELLDYAGMQAEWRGFVGAGNIDVQVCESGKYLIETQGRFDGAAKEFLFGDVLEVSKYLAKHGEISPADLVHVYQICDRKRLAFTWGNLLGVQMESAAAGDITEEIGPWVDYIARWNWTGRNYNVVHRIEGAHNASEPKTDPQYQSEPMDDQSVPY